MQLGRMYYRYDGWKTSAPFRVDLGTGSCEHFRLNGFFVYSVVVIA